MTDNLTPEQRRKTMSAIRSKDTSIEVALRKELWSRGLRYRKNCRSLPGKPDIAFIGPKVAVFCDSEFWHGYEWDGNSGRIKSNRDYWIPKIERNMARDAEVRTELESLGYTVLRFWGKDIRKNLKSCADEVENAVRSDRAASARRLPAQL
ncbi:MAG: very short patch repair endonuclease [Candidatus Methanoplasma sp.]|jgi:DNA mismatch endonuclease Vsr|nr:very short patch repair endonuclease [Candidatus Methanoplasma sp.]